MCICFLFTLELSRKSLWHLKRKKTRYQILWYAHIPVPVRIMCSYNDMCLRIFVLFLSFLFFGVVLKIALALSV